MDGLLVPLSRFCVIVLTMESPVMMFDAPRGIGHYATPDQQQPLFLASTGKGPQAVVGCVRAGGHVGCRAVILT